LAPGGKRGVTGSPGAMDWRCKEVIKKSPHLPYMGGINMYKPSKYERFTVVNEC